MTCRRGNEFAVLVHDVHICAQARVTTAKYSAAPSFQRSMQLASNCPLFRRPCDGRLRVSPKSNLSPPLIARLGSSTLPVPRNAQLETTLLRPALNSSELVNHALTTVSHTSACVPTYMPGVYTFCSVLDRFFVFLYTCTSMYTCFA